MDHDAKFRVFSDWASYPKSSSVVEDADDASTLDKSDGYFAMQVVQQVNFGPLESKRYFITAKGQDGEEPFVEVAERYLIDANYKKVNSYVSRIPGLFGSKDETVPNTPQQVQELQVRNA